MASTGQTALCTGVHEDLRNHPVEWFETAAELAARVVIKDETVAVINVDGMESNIFDETDVKTLETHADQLSVALENINLLFQ